jgi:DNA-binding response OmpR family regulator
MKLPYRVLVLEDDENALAGVVELLTESGFDVTPATTYDDAKHQFALGSYDLFVTDIRLRGYNGLHLVAKVRKESPETGIIIMTGYDEPLLELEASRYNAQFIKKPIKASTLLEAVTRCLNTVRRERRWPRTRVLDVSYGGLCLQIAATGTLPPSFDVEVAGIGLNLVVEPVWSTSTAPGALLCGAALASDSTPAARQWREIVDRLSA